MVLPIINIRVLRTNIIYYESFIRCLLYEMDMYKKHMPKRYCGFKMIGEDGISAPASWTKFNGFTVKEEMMIDETGPSPIKKTKLVNQVIASMNSHH